MKDREQQILEYILENHKVPLRTLLNTFHISKRTLYYDIESINYHIRECGQIKNINRYFCYIGNYHSLQDIMNHMDGWFTSMENRKNYILYKILNEEHITLELLGEEMLVSKNTVVQTMDEIRNDLMNKHLHLLSKPRFMIVGKEELVRNLFIILMQEDNNILNTTSDEVMKFDKLYNLKLTDYSLATLSKFISFVNTRCVNHHFIPLMKEHNEIRRFSFYAGSKQLLKYPTDEEVIYLSAYISSLPSLDTNGEIEVIDHYIQLLIHRFEAASATVLESKEDFKKNIKRHLLSSYYRIKFHFPIRNPSLEEIKRKHEALFVMIKRILENEDDFPAFKGIREEEIGFLAAYFGGYLKGSNSDGARKNKVLIVCPNGLMVSKSLEVQLYKFIPTINIVGVIALKDLKNVVVDYDYIVTTIDISGYDDLIIVNPLLTRLDIDHLMDKLLDISADFTHVDIALVMNIIKKHSNIHSEEKLKRALENVLYKTKKKEMYQPMLKELITRNKIVTIQHIDDWKEAIRLAAQPLVEDGSIETAYIDQMIESVLKHGPYIVLADRFALPHASNANSVHKLGMSLLIVKDEVDLLGKPVNLFAVLATTDNTSHIKALASLSEILYDQKNIDLICEGDKDQIMSLVDKAD